MSESESKNAAGKGRPTPSRKQQEKANHRPLVGGKTPEARKAQKEQLRADRAKARAGSEAAAGSTAHLDLSFFSTIDPSIFSRYIMMAGDEKYLTARDRGPQKRFVRDFIDSKFTLGEVVMPALFVMILLSAVDSVVVQVATLLTMWVLFIGVGLHAYLLGRTAKKQLAAKYGSSKVDSGIVWYSVMRSIQMRPMRLPKPQVKRGTKVTA